MKLLVYTIGGQKMGIDITVWNDIDLGGNDAFLAIEDNGSIPTDYVDISSILNWDNYGGEAGLNEGQIRQEIKKLQPSNLDDLTPEEVVVFETLSIFDGRYYKEKSGAMTTTSKNLQTYDTLTVDVEAGTYDLNCFFVCSVYSTSKSMNYTIHLDDVSICILDELSIEVKDTKNEIPINFRKDIVLGAGSHDISIKFSSSNNITSKIYGSSISLTKVS